MEAWDAKQFVSDSVARLIRIRTLIYSATADDGSGRWPYAIDVEHRIPHRVSSGVAEQYLSVEVDQVRPHRLVATVANPTASLWTVPIANDVQPESASSRFKRPMRAR
jgi:hypothetical protein